MKSATPRSRRPPDQAVDTGGQRRIASGAPAIVSLLPANNTTAFLVFATCLGFVHGVRVLAAFGQSDRGQQFDTCL